MGNTRRSQTCGCCRLPAASRRSSASSFQSSRWVTACEVIGSQTCLKAFTSKAALSCPQQSLLPGCEGDPCGRGARVTEARMLRIMSPQCAVSLLGAGVLTPCCSVYRVSVRRMEVLSGPHVGRCDPLLASIISLAPGPCMCQVASEALSAYGMPCESCVSIAKAHLQGVPVVPEGPLVPCR